MTGWPAASRLGSGSSGARWEGQAVYISTLHPRRGEQDRGHICLVSVTGGWRCRWRVVDRAGVEVVGVLRGDYLDAQAGLLTASAALDRP